MIPSEPTGLDSRLSRSTDECDDGIADSIPSEPPEISSSVSPSVADLFGLGDDTLDALDGEDLPDQVKPIVCFDTGHPVSSRLGSRKFRSTKDLFREDDDDGITDSTRFPASLLDSAFVSRIQWTIHSVSTKLMESTTPSRFQASLLDSALDSFQMIKKISHVSICRDNS